MSKIFFIRHWKTDNNIQWLANWWESDQDLSLEWLRDFENPNFKELILWLNIEKMYYSPLKRTLQTALKIKDIYLSVNKSILLEENEWLKEQLYWEFTGRSFEDILKDYPKLSFDKISYIYRLENTKWESWDVFVDRVYKSYIDIKNWNLDKNILLVAHWWTYRALCYKLMNQDLDNVLNRSNWLKNLEIREIN